MPVSAEAAAGPAPAEAAAQPAAASETAPPAPEAAAPSAPAAAQAPDPAPLEPARPAAPRDPVPDPAPPDAPPEPAPEPASPDAPPEARPASPTPEIVRGIYVTMWTASSARMSRLLALIDRTELNAVVIDVKDSQGNLAYEVSPRFGELVAELRRRGVYVIARLSLFQDSRLAKRRPDLALRRRDGSIWRDRMGYGWMDAASPEVWAYNFAVARRAVGLGVHEINFDYVRFPSDGRLDGIVYPVWKKTTPRVQVIRAFMAEARRELGDETVLSVDLFAFSALRDDMGIGQRLQDAGEFFDYVCPMAYPSHYSRGNFGFANPAAHPYEVVAGTLDRALVKVSAAGKLRPWLQDFHLGARYDAGMVRAQMRAALERGASGWVLWNAGNVYTEGALRPERGATARPRKGTGR